MDQLGLSPERLRDDTVRLVQGVVDGSTYTVPSLRRRRVRDDCWLVESASIEEAVKLGVED